MRKGVGEHARLTEPDVGDGRFRFRTPSLRNVTLTAPYMHNGVLAMLEDVLRFYDNGRSENPNVSNQGRRRGDDGVARLSRRFRRVDDMSEREMQDIVAFLESLTDSNFDRTIPARVPSGLPPGGLIGSLDAANGFDPFDTLAIGYAVSPAGFECASLPIEIHTLPDHITEPGVQGIAVPEKPYSLVSQSFTSATTLALYCSTASPGFKREPLDRLVH